MTTRGASFLPLAVESPSLEWHAQDEEFVIHEWPVLGPRKDKYGLVAKCVTNALRRLLGADSSDVRVLYVGDRHWLNGVYLYKWDTKQRDAVRKAFTSKWREDESEMIPSAVCVVLICRRILLDFCVARVEHMLREFTVPLDLLPSHVLDLNGRSEHRKEEEKMDLSAVTELRMADC